MKILLILCAFMLYSFNCYAIDEMDCESMANLRGVRHILRCENSEVVCYVTRIDGGNGMSCKFKA